MFKILSIAFMILVSLHGLIHLMGLVAYWPLGKVPDLPYKTTLLGGRWEVGSAGARLFSILWLLAVLGFLVAVLALALGRSWWAPVMILATLISLIVCILDWTVAFRGAWIDVALILILAVVVGLRFKPAPLPAFPAPATSVETVPLPAGLPAPVERFYRQTYGDTIPIYHSAVMTGRGSLRLMGITFPSRMRFSHISGKDYRHYFELTFFGQTILKANEAYLDGHNRLELPFVTQEDNPCDDSAANQGLWAESLAYPAIFLTDPRVHWAPIDTTHASLFVPYGDTEQVFTIQFDPQSGELTHFETMRCRDNKVGRIRWFGDITSTKGQDGKTRNTVLSATWEDEGTPWLIVEVEDSNYNADLGSYIGKKGA